MRTISLLIILFCGSAVGGCTGFARLSVIPLNFKKISDREPLVTRFTPGACYYWLDEQGRLCIAMAFENVSLIGDYGKRSMAMSLVLDEMPAGMGRNYRISRPSLRMITRAGSRHTRLASLSGIVAVWRDGSGRFRGRFRILAKQQQFHIALGWHGNSRAMLFGEFKAVPNPDAGHRILQRTEANGMERSQVKVGDRARLATPRPT